MYVNKPSNLRVPYVQKPLCGDCKSVIPWFVEPSKVQSHRCLSMVTNDCYGHHGAATWILTVTFTDKAWGPSRMRSQYEQARAALVLI